MPLFWESFVPRLEKFWSTATTDELKGIVTSFPYERDEVEQTLFQFRDAAGLLLSYHKRARFRECSCVDVNGVKKECEIKDKAWKCERPAFLLRKNLILESLMIERRRKANENKRISDAMGAAKKVALEYLNSDEGKDVVRSLAEKRVKCKDETGKLKEITSTQLIQTNTPVHHNRKNSNVINAIMDCFPWQKKQEKEIREAMVAIRNEFITKEIESRGAKAIETNRKMKTVIDAWLGLTTEDIFLAWRRRIDLVNSRKRNDDIKSQMEKERLDLEEKEKEAMAWNEVSVC